MFFNIGLTALEGLTYLLLNPAVFWVVVVFFFFLVRFSSALRIFISVTAQDELKTETYQAHKELI